jgi:uncharacterized membrane protein YuzA (DUF378 family)
MWLDALGLALVLLVVSALNWCWLWWFRASLLRVIYRKDASMATIKIYRVQSAI